MDAEAISLFLGENRGFVCIAAGALFAVGAARGLELALRPGGQAVRAPAWQDGTADILFLPRALCS